MADIGLGGRTPLLDWFDRLAIWHLVPVMLLMFLAAFSLSLAIWIALVTGTFLLLTLLGWRLYRTTGLALVTLLLAWPLMDIWLWLGFGVDVINIMEDSLRYPVKAAVTLAATTYLIQEVVNGIYSAEPLEPSAAHARRLQILDRFLSSRLFSLGGLMAFLLAVAAIFLTLVITLDPYRVSSFFGSWGFPFLFVTLVVLVLLSLLRTPGLALLAAYMVAPWLFSLRYWDDHYLFPLTPLLHALSTSILLIGLWQLVREIRQGLYTPTQAHEGPAPPHRSPSLKRTTRPDARRRP